MGVRVVIRMITSPWTEERLFCALYRNYGPYKKVTNVCVRHVPAYQVNRVIKHRSGNVSKVETRRYIDALVMTSSKSIWAVEMKVSSSDLRAELKKPEKAQAWAQHVNGFYFAVSPNLWEEAMDTVPAKYGIMTVPTGYAINGEREILAVRRRVKPNKNPDPMDPRTYLALARRAGKQDFVQCAATLVVD